MTVNSTGLWDLSQIPTADLSRRSADDHDQRQSHRRHIYAHYNGQTTDAIAYNVPASTVQSDLLALTNIGTGNVSVATSTGADVYRHVHRIDLAGTAVPTLTATSSLTGGTAPTIGIYTSTAGGVAQMISGPAPPPAATNTALTLVIGATQSASVTTGSGALALDGSDCELTNDGQHVVTARPGITTAVPATISGKLDLVAGQLGGPLAATRTITVADSPAADDLVISANIADGTLPGSLAFAGSGQARVVLSG